MIILKNQKYSVKLTDEERKELTKIKRSKSAKELTKTHAKALLLLDENNPKMQTPEQTAKQVKLHVENVYKLRKQFVCEGLDRVLNRKKRETPPVPAKVTGEVEAHIIAVACSQVPEGHEHWTLSLIAHKIVLDGVIDGISGETIRRVLKKRNFNLT
jgi:hypothetical protein